jgi:hypothetical protein
MSERDLDDADGWSRSLARIARSAPAVLPGVIQGAKTGAVAGPWGALAGGLAGGASRLGARRRTAPAPAAGAATTPAGTANAPAVGLLALLRDPRLAQAAAALTQGSQGPSEIPVGGTTAPPGAFMNLLSWLAREAAQQVPTAGSPAVDGYLRGADGEYVTDVACPAGRARALFDRLQAERGPDASPGVASGAERWLIESGLAELVDP